MKTWKVQIRDETACSVQSDLDLNYPQKLFVSSIVRTELRPSSRVLAKNKKKNKVL